MSSTSFNIIDPLFLLYRLQQSNCLSRWKQHISYSHSHVDRLLLFSFPRSQCRLGWIWTCIFMCLLESVSCTTLLSSTLPCLSNPFAHSTVFDRTNHPFYLVWPIISCLLPCLTNLNTKSAVLLKSEFLPAKSELVALLIFGLLLCLLLILTLCNESSWVYCLPFSLTTGDKSRLHNKIFLVLL